MAEITKQKDNGHRAAPGAVGKHALRPVLLHYAIARGGDSGTMMLHAPSKFREEVLVVFSSLGVAQDFFLSNIFRVDWSTHECSAGELVSLLLGPYKDIKWVLLDPSSSVRLMGEGNQANLMDREDFIGYLLG